MSDEAKLKEAVKLARTGKRDYIRKYSGKLKNIKYDDSFRKSFNKNMEK